MVQNTSGVAKRIKQIREEQGISQKWMAKQLGLSQSQYSRLEKDLYRNSIEKLDRISDLLGVGLDYILFGNIASETEVRNIANEYLKEKMEVERRFYNIVEFICTSQNFVLGSEYKNLFDFGDEKLIVISGDEDSERLSIFKNLYLKEIFEKTGLKKYLSNQDMKRVSEEIFRNKSIILHKNKETGLINVIFSDSGKINLI